MDRSFLSDEQVVAASRQFVCVRLSTYESQAEADFLKTIFVGRSGEVENTTFAVLSPDAKRQLVAAGRGPHRFRNGSQLAARLEQIADGYPAGKTAQFTDPLPPQLDRVDLALNVAACDALPLIVTCLEDTSQRQAVERELARLAWTEALAGQFVYVSTSDAQELQPLSGRNGQSQIMVVHPGPYGLTGRVMHQFEAVDATLLNVLKQTLVDFPRTPKDYREHRSLGLQLGLNWKTKIPETDPRAARAKSRAGSRKGQ
ncbi:MAG: thioredoxin family protein [Pirellulaceae bacterium]|nr:thioredoxin family protein [Pirellulaceae bacterium]